MVEVRQPIQRLIDAIYGSDTYTVPEIQEQDCLHHVLGLMTQRGFPRRCRRVFVLRFGLEDGRSRTLKEVGREVGVTRERIRQIEVKGLRMLRHPTRSSPLRAFLKERH